MHPPQRILDQIERLHKWARLGWKGTEDTYDAQGKLLKKAQPDEGTFMLLQLYHKTDVDKSISGLWPNEWPVYGSKYDKLDRIPVMVGMFSKEEVFSGECLVKLRHWMKPIRQRIIESALEKGQAYERQVQELAGEQGSFLYWKAKRKPEGGKKLVSKSDVTEEDKAVLRGERMRNLREAFLPPKGSTV